MVKLLWRAGLVLLLLLVPAAAQTLPTARIFLLERASVPPSWLFGTMHSSDPEIVALPREVRVAFGRSRLVVGELDMSATNVMEAFLGFLLPAGESLQDILPPDLYAETAQALESRGLFSGYLHDRLQPWAAAVVLSFDQEEIERQRQGVEVLDDVLQRLARERGKAVVGLETAAEQLAVFHNMPIDWQIEMLRLSLEHPELTGAVSGELRQLYLAGDHDGAWRYYLDLAEAYDSPYVRYFTQAAIVERNHRMAERLAPLLAEGGAFVAVGALHLPGPDGLLALLQRQGYRISALP
jgi:hypothetical protein